MSFTYGTGAPFAQHGDSLSISIEQPGRRTLSYVIPHVSDELAELFSEAAAS